MENPSPRFRPWESNIQMVQKEKEMNYNLIHIYNQSSLMYQNKKAEPFLTLPFCNKPIMCLLLLNLPPDPCQSHQTKAEKRHGCGFGEEWLRKHTYYKK
jgi:hypothetical protein